MSVDIPTLHGIWTLVLLVAFAFIVWRAYRAGARADLDEAARLALDDDLPPLPDSSRAAPGDVGDPKVAR